MQPDGNIADLAKQMLEADPEMAAQLKRYEEALARVDRAKAAAAQLEAEWAEASKAAAVRDAQEEQSRKQAADQKLADAEVAAAERMLAAAELEYAKAAREQERLSAQVNQGSGRVESGKAGAAAAVGGVLGAGLLLLQAPEAAPGGGLAQALSFLAAAASCVLFGVTYRYAVGREPSNTQLKGGVVAAFGLVRAAAAADVLQLSSASGPFTLEVIGSAALYAGQSMLMFAFAATAVEVAFQQGLIKRVDDPPASV